MPTSTAEAAAYAARLIVDERCPWALARQKLARTLPRRSPLPGSQEIESAVREHLAVFCPEHPRLLAALRAEALAVMLRLGDAGLPAWIAGAVLNGAATEDSNIALECFSDNPKEPEMILMDLGIAWEPVETISPPALESQETIGWLHPVRPGSVLSKLLPGNRFVGVTLDVLPEKSRGLNPRRAAPDSRQLPAEAAGRLDAEGLRQLLQDSRPD